MYTTEMNHGNLFQTKVIRVLILWPLTLISLGAIFLMFNYELLNGGPSLIRRTETSPTLAYWHTQPSMYMYSHIFTISTFSTKFGPDALSLTKGVSGTTKTPDENNSLNGYDILPSRMACCAHNREVSLEHGRKYWLALTEALIVGKRKSSLISDELNAWEK